MLTLIDWACQPRQHPSTVVRQRTPSTIHSVQLDAWRLGTDHDGSSRAAKSISRIEQASRGVSPRHLQEKKKKDDDYCAGCMLSYCILVEPHVGMWLLLPSSSIGRFHGLGPSREKRHSETELLSTAIFLSFVEGKGRGERRTGNGNGKNVSSVKN